MKKTFFMLLLGICSVPVINAQPVVPDSLISYVNFIEKQKHSAKDYIIGLFDRYNIVVFCERFHDELTQYELLIDLFSDSRFYKQVGDIFMEMGGSNYNNEINNYLFSENLSQSQSVNKALQIQRNAMWYPLWSRYNYHFLLTGLYNINKSLSGQTKMKLHPTDIAVDWNNIMTPDDVTAKIFNTQDSRDSVMGNNIVAYIKKNNAYAGRRKKYFAILNSAHSTKGVWQLNNYNTKSATSYIFEAFGNRVANVLINFENVRNIYSTTASLPETVPILNCKLDAAFEFLGIDDKGFDIKGSPLENQPFENMMMQDSTLTNEKVFTGFVFYRSFPRHEIVNGVPGLVDEAFKPELMRRNKLWYEVTNDFFSDENFNKTVKQSPEGLSIYWARVMYWIGGGRSILIFHKNAASIDETIHFINEERKKGSNSEYNVSEMGINSFGYALMQQKKYDEALAILLLNTQLYPNSWNTFDSYGEILLKLDHKEEAVKAYKRSLELNPKNEKAKLILDKLK